MADLHSVVDDQMKKRNESLANNKRQKISFGYSVDDYDGVLAALKAYDEYYGTYSVSVMGDDYTDTSNLKFDGIGFSTNKESAIWKMELGLFGSIPILNTNEQKYSVISTENYTNENILQTANQRTFPYMAHTDAGNHCSKWNDNESFEFGAYVDVEDHLFKYFDYLYNTAPNISRKITVEDVRNLAYNKLLMAQVLSKDGKVNCEMRIIGRTHVGKHSRILLSPALFNTVPIRNLPITVTMAGGGNKFNVFGDASVSQCRCEFGNNYNQINGSIDGLNKKYWDKVVGNPVTDSDSDNSAGYKIMQPPTTEVFVKIFIHPRDREKAMKFLPTGVSENIFKTYVITRVGAAEDVTRNAGLDVDVAEMKRCLKLAADTHGCTQYTSADISEAGKGGSMSGMKSWCAWYQVSQLPKKKAMAGSFIIPSGWPMGITLRKRDSVSRLRTKGHPYAGDSKWGNSWAIAHTTNGGNPEERFDPELEKPLTGQIMSGTMPREWYQERIRRANLGDIEFRCAEGIADAWNNVFKQTKEVFLTAVENYNKGKPLEKQISFPEMLLRCAPALCALNGAGNLGGCHRYDTDTAHGRGSALDFDPTNNYLKTNKAAHLKTEIASKIDWAYRPFIHYVYQYGGGWGGQYKFQGEGTRQYDGMHFQMSNYSIKFGRI